MYNDYGAGAALAGLLFWLAVFPILLIVFYVLSAIFLRKLFIKAGVANPNVAWIPIYNFLILAKLADLSPWVYLIAVGASAVLGAIPVLGQIIGLAAFVVAIGIFWRVNVKLGKEPIGFTIFAALLSIIWLGVVAFDSSTWRTGESNGVARPFWHNWGAFFHDTTTWGGVPYQGYSPPAAPAAGPATPPAA
jgi:hypothetical protein